MIIAESALKLLVVVGEFRHDPYIYLKLTVKWVTTSDWSQAVGNAIQFVHFKMVSRQFVCSGAMALAMKVIVQRGQP